MTIWPANLIEPPLEAVILFGSKSRGDADAASDTDLAIFAEASSPASLISIKRRFSDSISNEDTNFAIYSLTTAERMATDGSLFLWHIKLEGRILFQRSCWLIRLLDCLAPYGNGKADRDIRTFEAVLSDVTDNLSKTESTLLFEAATLFSVLRSLGMIATALVGSPCFGRLDPIFRTRELMGDSFRLTDHDVMRLVAAKLIYSGKRPFERLELTTSWCNEVKAKVLGVANFARGMHYEPTHRGAQTALRR